MLLDTSKGDGPIIYISNSPWNLYDYLWEFLKFNKFPKGEIILRDHVFHPFRSKKKITIQDKYIEINKQLKIFENTHFLLVGDSAEIDFDIYYKIYTLYPERIKKVIIFKANNISNERRISEIIQNQNLVNFKLVESYRDLYLH